MRESKELRRRAALARWAASFRTDGGHEADDHLRVLADRLDREAQEQDHQSEDRTLSARDTR